MRFSKARVHLPSSTQQSPWGPPVSAGFFIYPRPPLSASYRFPLLPRQAPEASLSLKTLGEKSHEHLQETAFPTQPLPPAPAPQPSVSFPGKDGGCWWPSRVPSKVSTGRVSWKGDCHLQVPLRSTAPKTGNYRDVSPKVGDSQRVPLRQVTVTGVPYYSNWVCLQEGDTCVLHL